MKIKYLLNLEISFFIYWLNLFIDKPINDKLNKISNYLLIIQVNFK